MNKRNANPFKMFGVWLGIIITGILGYFTIPLFYTKLNVDTWTISLLGLFMPSDMRYYNFMFFLILLYLVLGFLAGWGVTVLIRKLRK